MSDSLIGEMVALRDPGPVARAVTCSASVAAVGRHSGRHDAGGSGFAHGVLPLASGKSTIIGIIVYHTAGRGKRPARLLPGGDAPCRNPESAWWRPRPN